MQDGVGFPLFLIGCSCELLRRPHTRLPTRVVVRDDLREEVVHAQKGAVARGQTRTEMLGLIEPEPGVGYIAIAEATAHVLEKTKGLLEENAKRWFPK